MGRQSPIIAGIMAFPEVDKDGVPEVEGRLQFLYGSGFRLHYYISTVSSENISVLQEKLLEDIEALMREIQGKEGNSNDIEFEIEAAGKRLYEDLLPQGIRLLLKDLKQQQVKRKCELILLVGGLVSWIPWEIMHDGETFLGLAFQIARLPVDIRDEQNRKHTALLPKEVQSNPLTLHLSRVVNVLGKGALNSAQEAMWGGLFEKANTRAGRVISLGPTKNGAHGDNNVYAPTPSQVCEAIQQFPDPVGILHITCHGASRQVAPNKQEMIWTLDNNAIGRVGFNEINDLVVGMWCSQNAFIDGTPLVFASACRSTSHSASFVQGLELIFLKHGASTFIGTFASVTNQAAIEFAESFFKKLLSGRLTTGEALRRTKVQFSKRGFSDPSWLFYCLHGSPMVKFAVEPSLELQGELLGGSHAG